MIRAASSFFRSSVAAAVVTLIGLTACSGGSANSGTGASVRTPTSFHVLIPALPADKRHLSFISPSIQSVALSVNGGAKVVTTLAANSPNCSTNATGRTCTITIAAPSGTDTFAASFYDDTAAKGNLLAQGSTSQSIVAGQANNVGVSIGGVISSVALSLSNPNPLRGSASSTTLTAVARDADGNVIVADPYAAPISLTSSDTVNATQLSSQTLNSPTDTVQVNFTGGNIANVTFSATVAGVTNLSVTPAIMQPKTANATDFVTAGFNAQRTGENPSETIIGAVSVGNDGGLSQQWATPLADKFINDEPIVATNILTPLISGGAYVDFVYIGDDHGNLYGIDASTGKALWQRTLGAEHTTCGDIPDGEYGITGSPVFDRASNRLYVVDGLGILWALDPATGQLASGWPSSGVQVVDDPSLDHVYSSGTLDTTRGIYYAPSAGYCDLNTNYAALRAVDVTSGTVIATYVFGASSNQWGGGIWDLRGLSVDPTSGDVFGGAGNLRPNELIGDSDSVDRFASGTLKEVATWHPPDNGDDQDFGSTPVLYDDGMGGHCMAVDHKSGNLYIFNRDSISAGPTATLLLAAGSGGAVNTASPVYSAENHQLYITNALDGPLAHGVYAFNVQAGCTVNPTPAWSAAFGSPGLYSLPVLANGVLYVANMSTVAAFDASSGSEVWSSGSEIGGIIYAAPTIANGQLFVASYDGSLHAYSVTSSFDRFDTSKHRAIPSAKNS